MTSADIKMHKKALADHIRKSIIEFEEVTNMMVKDVKVTEDFIRQPSGKLTRYFEVELEVTV